MSTKVTVNTETNKVVINSEPAKVVTVNEPSGSQIVKVITSGPKGDKGDPGELSGAYTGIFTVTGSLIVSGGGISGSLFGTSSWAENAITASYVLASAVQGLNLSRISSGSATASITPTELSVNVDTDITGSLIVTNGITGSLFGTASWAENAVTASYVEYTNIGNKPTLFSGSSQVQLNGITGTTFADTPYTFPNDVVIEGNLTAEELIISSSVYYVTTSYSSGSTIFGNSLDDTHQFTGSLRVSGSITGSLLGTASFSDNSKTASTASYVLASAVQGLNLSLISSGSVTASVNINSASFQIISGASTFLFVSNSGFVGINRNTPGYSLDVSGSTRIGASVDTTTQGELLRLSVGSSASSTAYIGLQRANATYSSYNLGYIGTGKFGFWRTGDADSVLGFNSSTTNLVGINFGLPNGTINAQTSFYLNSSSQYTAPIRLVNNTTQAFGVYLPYITVNSTGTEYEYVKITGTKPASFAGSAVVGGLQFSIKSGSDTWINPFEITFDSKFLMTGSMNLSGSSHSIIGPTIINSLTGSLFGTSSWTNNFLTSSITSASLAQTASYVLASGVIGLNLDRITTGSVTASVGIGTASFQLTSGSSTFLFVSNSGNLGVNTAIPSYSLDVSGSGRFTNGLTISSGSSLNFQSATNNENAGISFLTNTGNERAQFKINWSSGEIRIGGTGGGGYFPTIYSNGSERARFFGNGNIAINTPTDSGHLLLISGSGASGSLNVNNILTISSSNVTMTGSLNVSGSATFYRSGSSDNLVKIYSDLNIYSGIEFGWSAAPTAELKASENSGTVQLRIKRGGSNSSFQIVTPNASFTAVEIARFSQQGIGLFTNSPAYQLDINGSGSFRQGLSVSGSFVVTGSASITGSLNAPNITGSLFGTASWAQNAVTASYITGSVFSGGNSVLSASYAVSASNSQTASFVEYVNIANRPTLFSGSSQVQLNQITGTTFADTLYTFPGDVVVQGNVTAEQLIISSSVIFVTTSFSSGSTIFGNSLDDTHRFTGSVFISNSLQVTGAFSVTSGINAQSITSSFSGSLTGTLIGTASWASNAITASYVTGSIHTAGNLALSASYAVSSSNSITASYSISASNAATASYVLASSVVGLTLSQIATGSVTASVNINSASFQVVSASTQLLFVSNSGLVTTQRGFISSSNGTISGSTLTVYGSGSSQPVFTVQGSQGELFSVSDSLSGSLFSVNDISGLPVIEAFSDNRVLIGSYQSPVLFTTVRTNTVSGNNIIYSLPTASYDGAFFEYTIKSGSNSRAGQVMSLWSGSEVNFTEVVTMDFGTTSNVKFVVQVTGSSLILTGSFPTANWTMKTIVRSI